MRWQEREAENVSPDGKCTGRILKWEVDLAKLFILRIPFLGDLRVVLYVLSFRLFHLDSIVCCSERRKLGTFCLKSQEKWLRRTSQEAISLNNENKKVEIISKADASGGNGNLLDYSLEISKILFTNFCCFRNFFFAKFSLSFETFLKISEIFLEISEM